ncbi:hypothetical protein D3C77_136600 [compost metagenome]
MFAHAADVAVHGKAQGIRVDATVIRAVETGLEHYAGVRLQELHHEAVGYQALVVEVVHQRVVPEGGPAFVHHLGLALRIEVLGDLAHDTHDFPLPGFEQGCMLFDEVENIFLRFGGEARIVALAILVGTLGNGAPQVIDLLLQVFFAFLLPAPLFFRGNRVRPLVAVNTVVHQGMAGVEQVFDRVDAMALLA